jgi:two-component system OmpR family response regulator
VSEVAAGARILLVEDDPQIAGDIAADLMERGYAVTQSNNGAEALGLAETTPQDLLIMDRLLPGMDGVTVIERLRAAQIRVPVLVISALNAVDDKVRGLKAGGDDYLTKPFALAELAARVEALLRRPLESRASILRAGSLELDLIDHDARRDGRALELLPRELKLLEYLMRRPEQLVTRAMLLEDVWHYRFVPQTNLVDVHVGRLRRKIDNPGGPSLIESVRGTGFIFHAPA